MTFEEAIKEAIKHEGKVVSDYERLKEVRALDEFEMYCLEYHRQLVEWLEDYKRLKELQESEEDQAYTFPEVFGEPIEMLIDGIWVKGKVINDYRSRDGIVNMETADGKKYWCGCEWKECYRQPKEGDAE